MAAAPSTTLTRHLPVRPDWLARHEEEILEPDLPIIDPHHHLWERSDNPYMADELLADLDLGKNGSHNIVGTVFVQCYAFYNPGAPPDLAPVGETEAVNGIAALDASREALRGICAGIVGYADLSMGADVAPVLDAHLRAGGAVASRFRGIRHSSAWDADESFSSPAHNNFPGMMGTADFRAGFAELAPRNLSYDAWLFHPQINELTDLARAFPGTVIVLDHMGGPLGINAYAGQRDEIFATWQRDIRELATCTNVTVKLGGLLMRVNGYDLHEGEMPPTSEQVADAYRPWVDVCLDAFGPERCMFESNFPVDKGSVSYPVFWNACKRLSAGMSDDEKTTLFRGTAERVYRLALPG
jgi:predicted TIM-barrel fold metal-dependent hydrolase